MLPLSVNIQVVRKWLLAAGALMALPAGAQNGPAMTLSDLQRFMSMVQQQIQGGEPWTKAEGRHVVLNYVASDPAYSADHVKQFVAMYDSCVDDDCRALKLAQPESKIPVYLFPKILDLQSVVHAPLQDGISMGYWSALPDDGKGVSPDAKAAAARQLGYALIHDQIGLYGCAVFNEGIALYLKGREAHESWLTEPKPLVATSLRELTGSARTPTELLHGAAFIAFLMNVDGQNPSRVKRVLAALSKERLADLRQPGKKPWPDRVEGAFEGVYGLTLDQLERLWRTG